MAPKKQSCQTTIRAFRLSDRVYADLERIAQSLRVERGGRWTRVDVVRALVADKIREIARAK